RAPSPHWRMLLVPAYPGARECVVSEALKTTCALCRGPGRGGTKNKITPGLEALSAAKTRLYNRRFLQMCSHYLVDPVACTPASGWEKGQVENQVGLVRERFFTPRLRFKTYDEMNAWLLDKCISYAKAHHHPE